MLWLRSALCRAHQKREPIILEPIILEPIILVWSGLHGHHERITNTLLLFTVLSLVSEWVRGKVNDR